MTTTTAEVSAKERYEHERNRLILRRQELQEIIDNQDEQETSIFEDRAEPNPERASAEDELESSARELAVLDGLIAEEQAKEASARLWGGEAFRAEGEALREECQKAFLAFGKDVVKLAATWDTKVGPAIKAIQDYWVNSGRPTSGPQHVTLHTPLTIGAMFKLFYDSAYHKDYVSNTFADAFIDEIPGRDRRLILGSYESISEAPGI